MLKNWLNTDLPVAMVALLQKLSPVLAAKASQIEHELYTAYQQPQRHYHTLQHIHECLQLFNHYRHLAVQPLAVEFALWFHDAVYQPKRNDNEQQSAAWAEQILQLAQVQQDFIEQVKALIMATVHQIPPKTVDEKLIVDIDLAILAAPPRRFAEYQQQIRAEYAWLAECVYQQQRQEVLRRLYNAGDIYHHPALKKALETAACANLQPLLF